MSDIFRLTSASRSCCGSLSGAGAAHIREFTQGLSMPLVLVTMIVSARVFLILLFPLLLHGAQDPPSAPGGNTHKWLLSAKDANQSPHLYQPSPESTPSGHSIPRNINLGVYVISDSRLSENHCELPPNTVYRKLEQSFSSVATTELGISIYLPSGTEIIHSPQLNYIRVPIGLTGIRILDRKDPLVQTTCVLPKGSKFTRLDSWKVYDLIAISKTSSVRVVTTMQGKMFFLPYGTNVIISNVPNYVLLPTGATGIRLLDKNDPLTQTTCTFPEDSTYRVPPSHESFPLTTTFHIPQEWVVNTQQVMFFLPRYTSVIVSDHISVPTGIKRMDHRDPLDPTTCILPKGSKFTRPNSSGVCDLIAISKTSAVRIVTTMQGKMFYLPRGTNVIISNVPNYVLLPTGATGIRLLDKNDPLTQTTCTFPEGSTYCVPPSHESFPLTTTINIPQKWVVKTQQDVFLLPRYTSVIVSDHISVPTGNTKIKRMDRNDGLWWWALEGPRSQSGS